MKFFTDTPNEWKTAHQYLDKAPDGTKLPYSERYNTSHSFIKRNGEIYCIERHDAKKKRSPNKGCYGTFKLLKNEKQVLLGTKIQPFNEVAEMNVSPMNEASVLSDLGLSSQPLTRRQDKDKNYTDIAILGTSLFRLLNDSEHPITDDERLGFAIQLCHQYYLLSEGLKSKTYTAYSHLDIKPENITIDKNGHVHLIDFGFSEPDPSGDFKFEKGTPSYIPFRENDREVIPKIQADLHALKKTLYYPENAYCCKGEMNIGPQESREYSLLNKKILAEYGLMSLINTEPTEYELYHKHTDLTPLTLTAILIAAKLKVPDYDRIIRDPILAKAVVTLYLNDKSDLILHYIHTPHFKIIMALCELDQLTQLDDCLLDKTLLENSPHFFSVVYLLTALRNQAIQYDVNAMALFSLQGDIPENHALTPILTFIKKNQLTQNAARVFQSKALFETISSQLTQYSQEQERAIALLLNDPRITPDEILDALKSIKKVQVVHYLNEINLQRFTKKVINSKEITDAIYLTKDNIKLKDKRINADRICRPHVSKAIIILYEYYKDDLNNQMLISGLNDVHYFNPAAGSIVYLQEHQLFNGYDKLKGEFSLMRFIERLRDNKITAINQTVLNRHKDINLCLQEITPRFSKCQLEELISLIMNNPKIDNKMLFRKIQTINETYYLRFFSEAKKSAVEEKSVPCLDVFQ